MCYTGLCFSNEKSVKTWFLAKSELTIEKSGIELVLADISIGYITPLLTILATHQNFVQWIFDYVPIQCFHRNQSDALSS